LLRRENADGVAGAYFTEYRGRHRKIPCSTRPESMPLAEYVLSGRGDARSSTFVFRRDAAARVLFDETVTKSQDWDFAIRFNREFQMVIDPVATVVVHYDPLDRMTLRVDHAASARFVEDYGTGLTRTTRARFFLRLARRTFAVEGRSGNFRRYVLAGRRQEAGDIRVRAALLGLSLPVVDKLVWLALAGYLCYRRRKTRVTLR
ncbi:MAG: hypothetical protein ACOC6F_02450, partial [bacterium]